MMDLSGRLLMINLNLKYGNKIGLPTTVNCDPKSNVIIRAMLLFRIDTRLSYGFSNDLT